MARHLPHGAGGGEDVIVGHLLVDRDPDAGLQDGLYLRSVVLRKIQFAVGALVSSTHLMTLTLLATWR